MAESTIGLFKTEVTKPLGPLEIRQPTEAQEAFYKK
jgi:hypothetical protein